MNLKTPQNHNVSSTNTEGRRKRIKKTRSDEERIEGDKEHKSSNKTGD